MTLKEQILQDIKTAMKTKQDLKRDTLRHLNAALKQVEVDKRVVLTDDEVVAIIQSQIKKRVDSIGQYQKGARQDLVQKEQAEIEILKAYLPKQLESHEIKAILQDLKTALNLTSPKDLGTLIKAAKEKIASAADGKTIADLAKETLNG